jgi:TRAP-type C4-dicarboxylate transport system permease small subunit
MISRIAQALAAAAAWMAGAVLVVLMILTVADVVSRNILNQPIGGVFDLTHFAVLAMVFLGLAYCSFFGAHVSIELIYDRLPPWAQRLLDGIANLVGAALYLLIAWRSWVQADLVRDLNEASELLQIPKYPFYWLLAAGAVLFALVMVLRIFVPPPEQERPS